METLHFGDPGGNVAALSFISIFAVLIGFTLYGVLAYPSFRRAEFRTLGRIPRRSALLIGAIVTALIIALAYPEYGLRFHQLDIQEDRLSLQYSCPRRTVTILAPDIEKLVKAMAGDKRGSWQLLIQTRNGKEYRSVGVKYDDLQTYLKRLEQLRSTQISGRAQ
ncbi:MAG TPA: hypothetical protein VNO70_07530 [Blastocatellia bacterium]|nr:hypothetical protein [Blastocatellia bacterium]